MSLVETSDPWVFGYEGFEPEEEPLREALCTLGNGYLATRGAVPGSRADGVHYPGTYVAGCYNRLASEVSGRTVVNESLVNLPDWVFLQIAIDDGEWLDLTAGEVLDHELRLDLRRGLLIRRLRRRDADRTLRVVERRLVHMRDEHLAALELTVVAEDFSGRLRVRSGLDGRVANDGVARYADLASQHLTGTEVSADGELLRLRTTTSTSKLAIAEAARTRLQREGEPIDAQRRTVRGPGWIAHELAVDLEEGDPITVDKVVAVHTAREVATFEPEKDATLELRGAGSFTDLLGPHVAAWHGLWDRFGIDGELGGGMDRIVRLHLFHLLQTVSPNTSSYDVGVPPRGLHGEAYRGLIMWDELFVLRILHLRLPALTRALLGYRYHRLPAARRAARAAGYAGAMYPWQSASNGEEAAQEWHLNPQSGRWVPDPTDLQRHIGLAVAYNVWTYQDTTDDRAYLAEQGAEILLEVARFFSSLATYDAGIGRYAIRGVVGPDEFHTSYPDADEPGLDNNAYTNVMAAWLFHRVLELPELLTELRWSELTSQLELGAEELERFEELSRLLIVPFHDGVISQYEGYEDLEELDWDRLREEHGDIHRLDRILEAEGDTPDRYKASKQADVLMLFYLFSAEELRALFERLGYRLDPETITRTIDYYLDRTSHGSTLSSVVHAWVLARAHREQALTFLDRAFASDVHDLQGGTTPEGIHLGALAGSVDLLLRCFTGLEVRDGSLYVNPVWPPELGTLEFDLVFRSCQLSLKVDSERISVANRAGEGRPSVRVCGPEETVELAPGQTVELATLGPPDRPGGG
ncbi:MAG: glycoside hydrolase family 65 protein [Nitriliruptoraceae bacterium]